LVEERANGKDIYFVTKYDKPEEDTIRTSLLKK
jgi:hypothetical protein